LSGRGRHVDLLGLMSASLIPRRHLASVENVVDRAEWVGGLTNGIVARPWVICHRPFPVIGQSPPSHHERAGSWSLGAAVFRRRESP